MQNFIIVLILAFVISSCSKTDPAPSCSWASGTLSGNTYKISKITQAGADFTLSFFTADACLSNSLVLNANATVTETKAAGCGTGTIAPATWNTSIASTGNQIVLGAKTYRVASFDCSSFTMEDSIGSAKVLKTWTKQ